MKKVLKFALMFSMAGMIAGLIACDKDDDDDKTTKECCELEGEKLCQDEFEANIEEYADAGTTWADYKVDMEKLGATCK